MIKTFYLSICILLVGNSGLLAQEQIFVHSDKRLYVSGETIWLSAYCLNAKSHTLSELSAIAYLELLDESSSPIIQKKISLTEGQGSTQFYIHPDIPSGVFYVRAYTQWMRNSSSEDFFGLPLLIINPAKASKTYQNEVRPGGIDSSKADSIANEVISSSPSGFGEIILSKKQFGHREKVQLSIAEIESPTSLSISVYKIEDNSTPQNSPTSKVFNNNNIQQYIEDKTLTKNTPLTYPFLPEMKFPYITGKIEGFSSRNIHVSFSGLSPDFYTVPVGPAGEFALEVSPTIRQTEMLFWAKGEIINPEQLTITSPFSTDTIKHLVHPSLSKSCEKLVDSYYRNIQINHIYADQSHIQGCAPKEEVSLPFYGKPQISYKLDDYTRFPSLSEVLLEYINKAKKRKHGQKQYVHLWDEYQTMFTNSSFLSFDTAGLVLIDGIPILDPDFLWNFDVFDIEQVDIIPKQYYAGQTSFAGIINFMTYRHNFGEKNLPAYIIKKRYTPIQQASTFFAPDYANKKALQARTPDFRTTLYWNPSWKFSPERKSLFFYTGDDTGWYQMEVNGISKPGKAIYLQTRFKVGNTP